VCIDRLFACIETAVHNFRNNTHLISGCVLFAGRLVPASRVTCREVRDAVRTADRAEYLLVANATVRALRFKYWLVPAESCNNVWLHVTFGEQIASEAKRITPKFVRVKLSLPALYALWHCVRDGFKFFSWKERQLLGKYCVARVNTRENTSFPGPKIKICFRQSTGW
jgi:hypothetical protein